MFVLIKCAGNSSIMTFSCSLEPPLDGRVSFDLTGKSTFKEEFVTAGGIELKEIDFRTMESRVLSDLYFAGEVLNIDAVTGGFNFQAAWTTSWIAASAIAKKLVKSNQLDLLDKSRLQLINPLQIPLFLFDSKLCRK